MVQPVTLWEDGDGKVGKRDFQHGKDGSGEIQKGCYAMPLCNSLQWERKRKEPLRKDWEPEE